MESKKLRVLAVSGMLAAVGYVLQLFEFPLLPAASFLKFDFGDVAVFIAGSTMGPGAMVLCAMVKGILWAVIGRGADGWVGAGMNTVAVVAFALPVSLLARSRRYWVGEEANTIRVAPFALPMATMGFPKIAWINVIAAGLGAILMTTVMVAVNLAVDPWYFKLPLATVKAMVVTAIIPFNLLRGTLNGVASNGIEALIVAAIVRRATVSRASH